MAAVAVGIRSFTSVRFIIFAIDAIAPLTASDGKFQIGRGS
jgi:hypothetical protein